MSGCYRTIVADPPWDQGQRRSIRRLLKAGQPMSGMSDDEIERTAQWICQDDGPPPNPPGRSEDTP